MDGIFKKIVFVFLFLAVIGCKKDEKPISNHDNLVLEGKTFIRQNLNILIDSVEQFDVPLPNGKHVLPKITIGLIDSVSYHGISNPYRYLGFRLKKSDLAGFKSSYKLNLVKENNNDANVLFVRFSNFRMKEDYASIVVEKVIGIGMIRQKYYFQKENDVWIFTKKRLINMG